MGLHLVHIHTYMQVDLECSDGRKAVGLYSHKKLSV